MGGSGSGNWYRHSTKPTTANFHRWDIRKLVSTGVIKDSQYRSGSWEWYEERYGQKNVLSTISYIADTTDMCFPYAQVKYQNKGSEEKFDYKVRLTTTSPNYGGKRWWFVCPINGCGKRVGVLYLGSKYFACRHCYNVAYESQNEAPHYRMLSKAQKIHRKLGGSGCTDDWVTRPKGMHRKTYDRLIEEMELYNQYSMALAAQRFGLIGGI